jgi:hypothetical protein
VLQFSAFVVYYSLNYRFCFATDCHRQLNGCQLGRTFIFYN